MDAEEPTIEELWKRLESWEDVEGVWASHIDSPETCPNGPHRGPEGPNEDLGQCPRCLSVSWVMRPENEQFGLHMKDCSLPLRHPSYCEGGGEGHAPVDKVRGYWGPCTESDIENARKK